MKNKWFAFFLSFFIPGLGQLYAGERASGLSFLCITAGAAVIVVKYYSWLTVFFISLVWVFIMIPTAIDAYRIASGKPRRSMGDSVLYVIFMLLAVGPFAIPLLWQSAKFSKGAKIAWTVLVVSVVLLGIAILGFVASALDTVVKETGAAMSV